MSNEQRAHDLTMLYLNFMKDNDLRSAIFNPKETVVEFDFYTQYRELYPKLLEKVNRDFSNI